VTIACCLVLSAFFSAAETALTALGEAKVRQLIDEGRGGRGFLEIWLKRPERVFSSLLLGNTVANVAASALAGSIASDLGFSHAVVVATGLMTLAILFFSEVTPKTLAKRYAERYVISTLPLITLSYWALLPLAWPLVRGTQAISRLLTGSESSAAPSITSEEIEYMIDLGTRAGVLDKVKEELLNSVLEFADILVKEIMVPRTQMLALDRACTPDELLDAVVESQHNRIPVYQGSVDNIVGVLYVKAIIEDLRKGLDRAHFHVDKYLQPPFFVPEIMKISKLLREFQKRKTHIAIVVDEFGGTSGLVCLEDVVEEIVGEIQDESDVEEGPMKVLADGKILAEGSVPIRDLEDLLQITFPEDGGYETLGGFLVATAGRVPPMGTLISWRDLTFTVLAGDERRISKVEIHRKAQVGQTAEARPAP
jgi:CBS domain containing-hemolysin-like protein